MLACSRNNNIAHILIANVNFIVLFVTKDSFDYFCRLWGSDYPYCALKKTRSQYYVKYMIMMSKGESLPGRQTPLTVVLTSAFDKETLQHLLLSKQGIPLCPAMDKIMDWMYAWGKSKSRMWYDETIELFSFYFHEKIRLSERELMFEVIAIKVRQDIHLRVAVHTDMIGWTTYNEWVDFFNFYYEASSTHFYDLTTKSISYVSDRCDAMLEQIMTVPVSTYSNGQSSEESRGLVTP